MVSCRLLLVDAVKWSARIVGSLFILWKDNNKHVLQFHLPCHVLSGCHDDCISIVNTSSLSGQCVQGLCSRGNAAQAWH